MPLGTDEKPEDEDDGQVPLTCDPDAPSDMADILVVIDNSPSMSKYQGNFAVPFRELFSNLTDADVDWQIAFTSTDNTQIQPGFSGAFYNLENANGEF